MNKQILLLAAGNHQLYKRRRDSEPLEVLQMRMSAKAEKDAKLAERWLDILSIFKLINFILLH